MRCLSSRFLGAVAGPELHAHTPPGLQEALLPLPLQRLVQRLPLKDPLERGFKEAALERVAEPWAPGLHLTAPPGRLVEGSWDRGSGLGSS